MKNHSLMAKPSGLQCAISAISATNSINSENSTRPQQLVSLAELAQTLGRSENSIRYHLRMGRIKPTVKLGRCYCFNLDQVMKDLQRGLK